jgi:hypothetical protein
VTSNLCSANRQKPRRRKQEQLNVQAPQAHEHPVYAVEPHQGQFATVANVAQMPGMCCLQDALYGAATVELVERPHVVYRLEVVTK